MAPEARATRGRRECRICWHVYDPAQGDLVWQVPPGTPFADLPAHWTCPECAATNSYRTPSRTSSSSW